MKKSSGSLLLLALLALSQTFCASQRQTGKLLFVSIEEETALGQEVAVQAGERLNLLRNQEVARYLDGIAAAIGAQSQWSGLTYTVEVINEPDLNHFSLPGGRIFIFRGLLEVLASRDQVAAVVAHEIAHIAARDGVERLAGKYGWAVAAQSVVGRNPEIARQLISNLYTKDTILDYPKPVERAADRKCATYLAKAGFDPMGLTEMLTALRTAEGQHPALVALLRRTHASASSRYHHVIKDVRLLQKPALTADSGPEFTRIRDILSRIPY